MRLAALAPILVLAACQAVPVADTEPPVPDPLPAAVTVNLPTGVPASAVGLQDRCFIYDTADGAVARVIDDAGRPVCL